MQDIQKIRKYMEIWKEQNYQQGIDYCSLVDKKGKTYEYVVEILNIQKLTSKKMDGDSVTKIPRKEEKKMRVSFTDIFWNSTGSFISPAYYVALIVDECIKKGELKIDNIAGIVGRGLRAFPSFLREMDLANKVSIRLSENFSIESNPEQDIKNHTDILIKTDKGDYRVWSYQKSTRGLENIDDKFFGKRGEIPDGYHLLCPIDINVEEDTEDIYGWRFYSDKYVDNLCNLIYTHENIKLYKDILEWDTCRKKKYFSKMGIIKK